MGASGVTASTNGTSPELASLCALCGDLAPFSVSPAAAPATTKEKQKFSAVDGALGTSSSGPTCTATDADPENGTSDYAESVAAMSKRDVGGWGWSSKSRFVRA